MISVETMLSYFNQIRKFYANELNRRLKDENFSPNEISILILLSHNKTIDTCSDLRMILGVSKGLISRSIDSLIKKNMIESVIDEKDKRIHRLRLTKESCSVIEKINYESRKINQECLRNIDEKDIHQMEETMLKILNTMKEKGIDKNETQNV